jgi:hypothetical protein
MTLPVLAGAEDYPAFDQLLRDYQDYGLPLPPAEAPLAEWPSGWYTTGADGRDEPRRTIGFLLEPAGKGRPAVTLVGATRHTQEEGDEAPRVVDPARVKIGNYGFDQVTGPFAGSSALATAVQCHARGYAKLATALYRVEMGETASEGPALVGVDGEPVMRHREAPDHRAKSGDDARARLAGVAWMYSLGQLVTPGSDRREVLRRFKTVLKTVPAFADENQRALGSILKVKGAPDEHSAPEAWAPYRAKVKAAMARRGF